MKREINYYVIGGQYEPYCYGGAPTLTGAKRIARKHVEYWDNWQGWHTPRIYRAKDTVKITVNGWITIPDGTEIHVPKFGVGPYAEYVCGKWIDAGY